MPELHTCLWNDVSAFDFEDSDFAPLQRAFPELTVICHRTEQAFLDGAERAEWILTWDFEAAWYARCPALRTVFTPAAGNDWVATDPRGRVRTIHGTFHGRILAESLLGAILFMNHAMPAMIENHRRREWDRNIQANCRLLRNQTVAIIGLGHIGSHCARVLQDMGARVIGIKRDTARLAMALPGVDVRTPDALDATLAEADHVVLLVPGVDTTHRLLTAAHLSRCKPGVFIYNFGRGNALASADVVAAANHIGGAFLDVTDEEPLPAHSPLWTLPNVMITPHSSCVYREYKSAFIEEVIRHGKTEFNSKRT